MKRRSAARRSSKIAPVVAALSVGIVLGWLLHAYGPPRPADAIEKAVRVAAEPRRDNDVAPPGVKSDKPVATVGPPSIAAAPRGAEPGGAIDVLQRHPLRMPIDGVTAESFKGGFQEHRSGDGGHAHDAVDILAPRHTPVHAVEDGAIAKLFDSKAGGHTIYQFDPSGRFAYYYAHLDRYAEGLHEGQRVAAGDVIGYVGTSGNAPAGTPHLHFAVIELDSDKRWWRGQALDPYLVFRR
jgi:murein DD-endopeptidase MepM/ murein hydrolase activator NlpD